MAEGDGRDQWIWQRPQWPLFNWHADALLEKIDRVSRLQERLLGAAAATISGYTLKPELDALLANIVQSSAIEGEVLNVDSVRSSLARRLGVPEGGLGPVSARSEGLVELQLDATGNHDTPLTSERLCRWHAYLFPEDEFRLRATGVGVLRGADRMQVVSGPMHARRVHFEAPPRRGLEARLDNFLKWLVSSRADPELNPILRAALAHLWFVTLHPFDDGNGRLARAITDYALAQAEGRSVRLYAMSAAIMARRREYYAILEQTQRGTLDVTPWLAWFLDTLEGTLESALGKVALVLQKARFWQIHGQQSLNKHQVKVLNRLLDAGPSGFEGDLSARKYMGIAGVSKATATRHLVDLQTKGALVKLEGGGRQTRYAVNWPLE